MIDEIRDALEAAVNELFELSIEIEVDRPDNEFGDLSCNVALKLASKVHAAPMQIAEQLVGALKPELADLVSDITATTPGFINFIFNNKTLVKMIDLPLSETFSSKQVVAEYSDPNPFKALHAGHLYTSVVGDAIANLVEAAGGEVHRVNFGGDVGLHVAKNMWAIIRAFDGENPDKLADIEPDSRADWLSARYIEGNQAYESDETAKAEIVAINKRVYEVVNTGDHDSGFAKIYWTGREWSYDYFNNFYEKIGSHFEKYYPESETAPIGLAAVREHMPDVYSESQGAVIFDGEKYGLHSRVFINSAGLPTYEAKDVGLIIKKWQDYHFDTSIIITANEIDEYMKVVLKSVEQFMPEPVKNTVHLTHGLVKLTGGVKMSSRTGNVVSAYGVIEAANQAAEELKVESSPIIIMGAIKYALLKSRVGGDIVYDPKESVSMEGNSGPYLQYSHARARSILGDEPVSPELPADSDLDRFERALVSKLGQYPEVFKRAVDEFMPHHICTYLYELAQCFNRFYENDHVKGDPREQLRLSLVLKYADRLKQGLKLLGIDSPDKM
jgi:arginyl-tRNA synthetase